jgi:hypothetical protein
MENVKFRKLISQSTKFPNTKQISPAPVCNEGFPGTFNLSFTESEWLKEFNGQYLDYNKDLMYSKIQPCIRHQDWDIIKSNGEDVYRYLSVFDMADVSGAISVIDGKKLDEIAEFALKSLYDFLIGQLKLSPEKLRVKYCIGGNVADVTKGKYPLEKTIEADPKIELWRRLGIGEDQWIPDQTRDSLLALHIYGLPTPWGYRNEVFYEHRGKLLDIATFEYLLWRPVFDANGNIEDIRPWEHAFAISAIGVERVLMVLNNHETVMECPHIKPLVEMTLSDARHKIFTSAVIFTEGLRAIHRIVSDAGGYRNLSKHRKQKIRDYYNGIFHSADILGINTDSRTFRKYLQKNADLQSYYPELMKSVDEAAEEMMEAKSRFTEDKSKKGV